MEIRGPSDILQLIPSEILVGIVVISVLILGISEASKLMRKGPKAKLRFSSTPRRVILAGVLAWFIFTVGSNLTGYQQVKDYEAFEFKALSGAEIQTERFLLIILAQILAVLLMALDFTFEVLLKFRPKLWNSLSIFFYYGILIYSVFYGGLRALFAPEIGLFLRFLLLISTGLLLSYAAVGLGWLDKPDQEMAREEVD